MVLMQADTREPTGQDQASGNSPCPNDGRSRIESGISQDEDGLCRKTPKGSWLPASGKHAGPRNDLTHEGPFLAF